ncbi:MAG TPA: DUF1707 domain-containing protein [Acidimicrobiales bacterium]|nr:DUF1707 domain-containing protein [Acidimicrobiales bacterium]
MVDSTGDGVNPGQGAAPLPIPELGDPPPADHPAAVTDEDRQQYGRLLDSAMERGLLSPYEYETRLRDLAEAPTIDELKRIVTELPIFGAPGSASKPASKPARPSLFGGSPVSEPTDGLPLTPGTTRALARDAANSQRSRWTKLIILLIVVIALFVALSIYAEHLVHNHNNPSSSAAWVAPPASAGDRSGATTLRP